MKANAMDTHQKALQINLDATLYGAFAEAGAGQEVARWFNRLGGASGTIARAVGALGPLADDSPREGGFSASRQRLESMLNREFQVLSAELDKRRGGETAFFAFADVVTGWNTQTSDEAHAWLGFRFQGRPRSRASQIVIRVRFQDCDPAQQQDVLGVLGVNLIYGAWHLSADPDALLHSLLENIGSNRVAIDEVEFSGPAFAGADNRSLNGRLVEHGLTDSSVFERADERVLPKRSGARRTRNPVRGGLMDSLHLAGMPKAA